MQRKYETIIPRDIGLAGPTENHRLRHHGHYSWPAAIFGFIFRRMLTAIYGMLLWPLVLIVVWFVAPAMLIVLATWFTRVSDISQVRSLFESGTQLMHDLPVAIDTFSNPRVTAEIPSNEPILRPSKN